MRDTFDARLDAAVAESAVGLHKALDLVLLALCACIGRTVSGGQTSSTMQRLEDLQALVSCGFADAGVPDTNACESTLS